MSRGQHDAFLRRYQALVGTLVGRIDRQLLRRRGPRPPTPLDIELGARNEGDRR